MSNVKNLKPFTLENRSSDEAVKNGKKGGKASAAARRKKRDLLKAVQDIIDGTYDEQGEKITGADKIALTLFKIASNPNHKQCIQAMRLIFEITGKLKSSDETKRDKLNNKLKEKEIELMQKRIDKLDEGIWE